MTSAQSTLDHDLFKIVVSNREVDERHVNKLMKAIKIKDLLHINPILCNSSYEVIDGQHRLEAAKRLNVPVYFILDNEISKKDIATINSNQKNWSTVDYINYWSVEKAPGFDKLSSFLSQHPLIPASTALMMLSSDGKRDMNALREGIVDLTNYDRACKIASIIKEYRNLIDHAYDRNFIIAVNKVVKTRGYDHAIMQSKLEYQSRTLRTKCISSTQYVELLEEIYNYRSTTKKLKFS